MVFTAVVTTLGPIIAAIVFTGNKILYWFCFTGAAVFSVSDSLRIPILSLFFPGWNGIGIWWKTVCGDMLCSLALRPDCLKRSADTSVYTILKKRLDWKNAVAFGIGHGGINPFCWLVYIYQQSDGLCNDKQRDVRFDDSSRSSTGRRLDAGKNTLVETLHTCIFWAGQRIFAFLIHIGLSVLIMEGIRKKKGLLYLGLAILLHMVIDSPVVILSGLGADILFVEILVLIFAIIAFLYVRGQRKKENTENASVDDTDVSAL